MATTPWKKLLCGIDFTDPSRRALDEAARLADALDAALTLVHVFEPPATSGRDPFVAAPGVWEPTLAELEARLRGWAKEASPTRPVGLELRTGAAADELTALAAEGAFDAIVVGTHGRAGLSHMMIGSVAEHVIRRAPCPVVVVRKA